MLIVETMGTQTTQQYVSEGSIRYVSGYYNTICFVQGIVLLFSPFLVYCLSRFGKSKTF